MKKIIALLVCLITCFGLVGCGEDPYANTTVLTIPYVSSGLGTSQLTDFKAYFEETYAETEFEEGKKGVYIDLVPVSTQVTISKGDGYDIYSTLEVDSVDKWVAQGTVLPITDLVTEKYDTVNGEKISIQDKIQNRSLLNDAKCKSTINGDYYAIPFWEFYPSLTYDVQTFIRGGFYFAQTETIYNTNTGKYDVLPVSPLAREHQSKICGKSFYFVNTNGQDKFPGQIAKSNGPDGKPNTVDDGLPATLEEFVALCEFMKSKGAAAVTMTGQHASYKNFIMEAVYTALLGPQQAYTQYAYDGKPFEVIVGFEDEPLFPGLNEYDEETGALISESKIKKPILKTVNLTESNGYYVTMSSAKYYALALAEILYTKGFLHADATNSSVSQRNVMKNFYNNTYNDKQSIGMLAECTFWFRECSISNYPKDFDKRFDTDNHIDRNFQTMSLPISFDGNEEYISTFNSKRQMTFVDNYRVAMFLSSTLASKDPETGKMVAKKGKEGKYAAAKQYLKDWYSNWHLNQLQNTVGIRIAVDYEFDDTTLREMEEDYFYRLESIVKNSKVVYYASDSPLLSKLNEYLNVGYSDYIFGFVSGSFLHQLHEAAKKPTAVGFFQDHMLNKDSFTGYVSTVEPSYETINGEQVEIKYAPYTFKS